MKNAKGFTLLEMMITVTIVGILAAVAYPSYSNYLIKGSRAAAKSYLLEVSQKQQQFLLDNRAYGTDAEIKALLAEPKEFTSFYTLAITLDAGPPPGFQAKATPKATTRQKGDGWLQIDHTGAKTS